MTVSVGWIQYKTIFLYMNNQNGIYYNIRKIITKTLKMSTCDERYFIFKASHKTKLRFKWKREKKVLKLSGELKAQSFFIIVCRCHVWLIQPTRLTTIWNEVNRISLTDFFLVLENFKHELHSEKCQKMALKLIFTVWVDFLMKRWNVEN